MIEIAPGGKRPLTLHNPTMPAAGTFGFGGEYGALVPIDRLGAVVTNPVTWTPRKPAKGPRVVPVTGGVLVHTGLANPGMRAVIRQYRAIWAASPAPVIVHVVATGPEDVYRCCEALDREEAISGVELGLHDQATARDIADTLAAAQSATQLPLIVRLPLFSAADLAGTAEQAGAHALTIAAPPRGTVRDPASGELVGGRLYGPWIKALALRAVGQAAVRVKVPVIGSGGIHSRQDARDYIDAAGAAAVQVDAGMWVQPDLIKAVANELGGLDRTRMAGSLSDEWTSEFGQDE
ncbi:MAG: hypothetical protein JXB47_13685 [Anaerolineae bacterium]|nr:hypothetical protein [Anaerolineae bacterium]